MATINLVTQQTSFGTPITDLTFTNVPASGDVVKYVNDGKKTFVIFSYEGTGSITLTVDIKQKVVGQTVNPKVYTLTGASTEKFFVLPILDATVFNDLDNKVSITVAWTGGTPTVKACVIQFV